MRAFGDKVLCIACRGRHPSSLPPPRPMGEGSFLYSLCRDGDSNCRACVRLAGFGPCTEPLARELKGVGVTEHLGDQIPLDLPFVDSDGKPVELKQFFDGKRPVILTLNFELPHALQSSTQRAVRRPEADALGLSATISRWSPSASTRWKRPSGRKDETEISENLPPGQRGRRSALPYRQKENIKKLADAVGFRYRYSEAKQQYFHVAVTFILTPDGHVSRYLYGVEYDPADRAALLSRRPTARSDRPRTRFCCSAFTTMLRAGLTARPPCA